ncbi:ACT domain-containing protein ACR6 isoform X2 [Gossypium hirsutum]|uniref:ACT domain-containing protein ACR n=2 Tax=Gossypium TaxID=3633 RepID=A0ABM3AAI2_GOSHI|nr:ACT domain-containing protein ACR6 isoform X2 [Gossypium hirsutum]
MLVLLNLFFSFSLCHSFACSQLVGFQATATERVVIDNNACEDATVIQVDSVNKHGILLEVVQVLTDMNLTITKAYISSDGGWFMDVFNVVDNDGNKIRDKEVMDYIQSES